MTVTPADNMDISVEDLGPDLGADNVTGTEQTAEVEETEEITESEPVVIIKPAVKKPIRPTVVTTRQIVATSKVTAGKKKCQVMVDKKIKKIDAAKIAASVSTELPSVTVPSSFAFGGELPSSYAFGPSEVAMEEPPAIETEEVPALMQEEIPAVAGPSRPKEIAGPTTIAARAANASPSNPFKALLARWGSKKRELEKMELERPWCTVEEPNDDEEANIDPEEYLEQASIEEPSAPRARLKMAAPKLTVSSPPLALTDEAEALSDDDAEMTEAQRKRKRDYQRRHQLPAPRDEETWRESLRPRTSIKSPRICDCCQKSEEECKRKDTKGRRKMSVKINLPKNQDGSVKSFSNVLPQPAVTATAAPIATETSRSNIGNRRSGPPAITHEGSMQVPMSAAAASVAKALVAVGKQEIMNDRKRGRHSALKQHVSIKEEEKYSLAKVAKQKENEDALLRREENKALRGNKLPMPESKGKKVEESSSETIAYLTNMARHYMGRKLLNVLSSMLRL